jgi:hypothetical protein
VDGYRDDLQAAQARLAQLEAELEALREGKASATRPGGQRLESGPQSPVPGVRAVVSDLRALVSDYKQKLAAAERRVAELELALEDGRKELGRERADREAERRAGERMWAMEVGRREDMLTVTEHNRRKPADERGVLSGVLCPLCYLSGHRTEMRIVAEGASCPRCRFAQRLVT